ncbi:GNAT family N-acetyltransferase [Haliovirga abyssi]|uniref:N-acetyltransferase YitI n=1 Tax=Haliovirga abyssi TaxID=2996794 RepID=A0AAU9E0D1_9FUSO|nr:GNAT family N-acetyltransferase [Haliovirga abyssi]BDU51350.1 putative N-acetyltransferase YitI [Haliovirga abyssi]
MNFIIKEANIEEVIKVRHIVMWPKKSIEFVKIPCDSNGKHYGVYIGNKIVSVISIFIKNEELQFRKFATLNEYQGQGIGTKLLKYIFEIALENNIKRIWCNARKDKSKFYTKFGMKNTDETFKKAGINYVIMEKIIRD